MHEIRIGNRSVGFDHEPFVIAEIGVNHDGSVVRALELVEAAAECGADAVKLQIFRAEKLMHESSVFATYQTERCVESSAIEMLKRYELSPDDCGRIVASVREHGMIPLATPFSLTDVDVIEQLGLPAVKIASPDLVNRPLLSRAAALHKPLIISAGAADKGEITTMQSWMRQWKADHAILHCVSSYPTPVDDANLCWITELARELDVPVGYSDHTQEIARGALAVAAGAVIIEKHLTYDRAAQGPDHSASADPQQFAEYVRMIRLARRLRGGAGKRVLAIEQDVRTVSRQSLVLACDLRAGQVIRQEHLTVQRPGTGIPAARISEAVGRKVHQPVKAGAMLTWDMLAEAAKAA
jgi:N-acetylneuraminate synthase/N,N'-diacetyllegionaminate synthase